MHSSSINADMRALQLPVRGLLCPVGGLYAPRQAPGWCDAGSHQQGAGGAKQGGGFEATIRQRCGHYTYNARKLMEHGPLSWAEFLEITGWPAGTASRTWEWLQERRELLPVNVDGIRKYRLA